MNTYHLSIRGYKKIYLQIYLFGEFGVVFITCIIKMSKAYLMYLQNAFFTICGKFVLVSPSTSLKQIENVPIR